MDGKTGCEATLGELTPDWWIQPGQKRSDAR